LQVDVPRSPGQFATAGSHIWKTVRFAYASLLQPLSFIAFARGGDLPVERGVRGAAVDLLDREARGRPPCATLGVHHGLIAAAIQVALNEQIASDEQIVGCLQIVRC